MSIEVTKSINGQKDLVDEVIASFPEKGRIIDIGTGSGLAARSFFNAGWEVVASGMDMDAYLDADNAGFPPGIELLPDLDICDMHPLVDASLDCVWCAHVLEHVSDTGRALSEIRRVLKPDGRLFIAVPPFKHNVVGGHVNSGWNLGTLMYVLADAGFDLSDGRFIHHGYNLFGIARRGKGPLPTGALRRANGDIETLKNDGRFPAGFAAEQGFNGQLKQVNWMWNTTPEQVPVARKMLMSPPPIQKMKIGFFIPFITKGRGGTENVGQMMANSMAKRGHDVTVFTFEDEDVPSQWPLDETIDLVRLSEAGNERTDDQMLLAIASRTLDLLVGLHMNRTFKRYVRCAHRAGVPLVLSEHIDPRFPRWIGTNTMHERQVAFYGASLIHLLTEGFRSTLPGFMRERIRVIPNTVKAPEQAACPGDATKQKKVLLTVARLVPRKNVHLTIEAFAKSLPEAEEWVLRIVGDGPERQNLEEQVSDLKIADSVEFVGETSDPYACYRDADAFVLSSFFEGFPLSTLEAMAHGLPLIGFANCSGVNEQITEDNGILCDASSPSESLAAAIQRVMADAKLREEMGQASLKRFDSHYSEEQIFAQWEEMFAEAVERGLPNTGSNLETKLRVAVSELTK
ncbi:MULTISPECIES: glycosyltransferase [unclassified Ruegeria]|uniref:glycosyltransferase n=1 Tax=unclassified Ruegeria TaxID=2625375 RepID=UPI0014899571|nr:MULTISPECIES: glycosyltransferase [unclassified Ruegeria]